jgi:hypothetical protein
LSDIATPLRHRGFAIASFAIALVAAVLSFAVLVIAGYLNVTHQQTPGSNFVTGMVFFLCFVLDVVAIGTGIAALFDQRSKKSLAVTGLALAGSFLLLLLVLVAVGLAKMHNKSAEMSLPPAARTIVTRTLTG